MPTLIELSIKGDIYLFLNTLTSQQLDCVCEFANSFFANSFDLYKNNILKDFLNEIFLNFGITLEQIPIIKVIAV